MSLVRAVVDEEIRPEAVRAAVVVVDAHDRPRELCVDFFRTDGVHCFLTVPLSLGPMDRGTKLLNRLRAHSVNVRVTRRG